MQLKNCQQRFGQALLPDCSNEQFNQARTLLANNNTLTPEQSILVYRHNITAALQRVLAIIYPVCQRILGEECFDNLAKDYVWQAESDCSDLDEFGAGLCHFLASLMPTQPALATLPYLPDLFRLEWVYHRAQTAADDVQTSWDGLQKFSGETLRLQLSHSLSLLETPFPLIEVWQQNQTESVDSDIHIPDEGQYLLVYRQQEEVKIIAIDAAVYRFLYGCLQGYSLHQLADTLETDAERVFAQLPAMIQYGWVAGFETHTVPEN